MKIDRSLISTRLDLQNKSWNSIEIVSHEDYSSDVRMDDRSFSSYHSESRYTETAIGQRRFEIRIFPKSDDRVVNNIDYCDGNKCWSYSRTDHVQGKVTITGREQIIIRRSFSMESNGLNHRPEPLKFFYVGLDPLSKSILNAEPVGDGIVMGRNCNRFLFTKIRTSGEFLDFEYWLDEKSSIPLRVDYFRNPRFKIQSSPIASWRAIKVETYDKRNLVTESEFSQKTNLNSNITNTQRYKISVDSVKYDVDYPESIFRPEISKNATLIDEISGKRSFPKLETTVKIPHGVHPIRAIDSAGRSFSFGSFALIFGFVLLLIALMLKLRPRANST